MRHDVSRRPARKAGANAVGCLLVYTLLQSFSALAYDIQLRRLTPWLRTHVVRQHIEGASLAEKLLLPGQYLMAKYHATCPSERYPILHNERRVPERPQPAYDT